MRTKIMLALAAATALLVPTSASALGAGTFGANLRPIPHDATADGGSNVTGRTSLRLEGRRLTIDLTATGVTPNEPHAMHIHGETTRNNECPPASADINTGDPIMPSTFKAGKPDGLISLQEGDPFYGPIDVSFTTTGDTSPGSGLTLERMPVADGAGNIEYHRTVLVSKRIARNLGRLHIVVHGADLPKDANTSSLSNLFEATLPVSCGTIN